MKGIMPIVIGVTAAMLAPLGEGQSRVPVSADAFSAADTDDLALDGCAVTFRAGDSATADRAAGCEEWLRSAAASGQEGRL